MTYTFDEWVAEGIQLFGEDKTQWKFQCPACGKVSTVSDFKQYTSDLNKSFQCCIGRFNGKGVSGQKCKDGVEYKDGCDWAAYGLFGTLGKGHTVIKDDKYIEVFAFGAVKVTVGEI